MSSGIATPLAPTLIVVSAGLLGLVAARLTRVSPIVTFFVIGALVGPFGFALADPEETALHFLSELGIAFLLFDIGLHLSISELRKSARRFLTVGAMQFVIVTALLMVSLYALGIPARESLALGAILSLSSTALVLKVLAQTREAATPVGVATTEVLVFQDLVAILLLVVMSNAANGISVVTVALPVLKVGIASIGMIAVGAYLLSRLFTFIIRLKNEEIFTTFALFVVLLTSWITEVSGLSLTLGAFLGGLALSGSGYANLVRSELAPFRGLLMSLFFLVVGMGFNFYGVLLDPLLAVALVAAFMLLKAVAVAIAARFAGLDRGMSVRIGFLLAQGSEFAFVLLGIASVSGVISTAAGEQALMVVGLSLAGTPLFIALGCRTANSMCRIKQEEEATPLEDAEVIIVGFDQFARDIASCLVEAGVPYRGHDRDLELLSEASSRGFHVYYSDPDRPRTLGRVSAGKALAVVCLIEDDDIARFLIVPLVSKYPELPVIAASSEPRRIELFHELGVSEVFLKRKESLPGLIKLLLTSIGIPDKSPQWAINTLSANVDPDTLFLRPPESAGGGAGAGAGGAAVFGTT